MIDCYPLSSPRAMALAPQAIRVGNVIVVDERHRILLGLRRAEATYEPGKWNLPGGRCEGRESYQETALRELGEEFGLIAESAALVPFRGYCCVYADRVVYAFYFALWIGSTVSIRLAAEEFSDGGFHPISDAASRQLAFRQEHVVQDYLAAQSELTKLIGA